MPKIKTKQSFGTVTIDHFSLPVPADAPRAMGITPSFEEALKLHLGLGQSSIARRTTEGRCSAANLCIYLRQGRITINEDTLKTRGERE